jgi:hypothetical protein
MLKDSLFFVCAWAAAVAGCSSDSSAPASTVCNTLTDDGPTITLMAIIGQAPTPAGGTVVDGTYVLAATTLYTAATTMIPPTTSSAVIQIAGSTMQQVGQINGQEKRYTSTFTVTGTSVATTDTCPAPSMGSHQYTATATELRIYDANPIGTLEQKYTKR